MFGLMKVSTHEGLLLAARNSIAVAEGQLDIARSGNARRDTRIATLETDLATANEKLRHAESELKRRNDDDFVAMEATLKKPARKPAPTKVLSNRADMTVAMKKLATQMKATGETIGAVGVVAVKRAPKKGAAK